MSDHLHERRPRQGGGHRSRVLRDRALPRYPAPRPAGGRLPADANRQRARAGGAELAGAAADGRRARVVSLGDRRSSCSPPPSPACCCGCATPAEATTASASQTQAERRGQYYHSMLTGAAHAKELRLFGLGSLFRQRHRRPAPRDPPPPPPAGYLAIPLGPGDPGGRDAGRVRVLRLHPLSRVARRIDRRRRGDVLPGLPARPGLPQGDPERPGRALRGPPVPGEPLRVPGSGAEGRRAAAAPTACPVPSARASCSTG